MPDTLRSRRAALMLLAPDIDACYLLPFSHFHIAADSADITSHGLARVADIADGSHTCRYAFADAF